MTKSEQTIRHSALRSCAEMAAVAAAKASVSSDHYRREYAGNALRELADEILKLIDDEASYTESTGY